MTEDPIIEEIHRTRDAIAGKFNNDLQAIADDARRRQEESAGQTAPKSSHQVPATTQSSGKATARRAG